MRNSFFKYLLLRGVNSASRSELESETLPYTFVSKSQRLRNYRIYGNTVDSESVGDLVTEGEYAGEYRVPVKVEGKNLLQNTAASSTINGVTFTVNDDGSVSYERVYSSNAKSDFYIIGSVSSEEEISLNSGNYIFSGGISPTASIRIIGFGIPRGFDVVISETATVTSSFGKIILRVLASETGSGIFYPMIRKADIEDDTYEPYHAPDTTNLYLPEQIKMVGDEAEYVDYKEQKQYFADGTSTDVTLPALPTLSGTNTLSVGTTVQPSKIWIQGNISEIETVSVQALQANMRSLQPLSLDDEDLELDVMPTDNDLQPDVMPIEKPVLNLNDVSEIENAEIERGVESAE